MSLILSGTDGLSDIDGTAATPAIRGTDANTGIFFPAADTIAFSEGGVEAARFDSSGNFGVGTSTFNSVRTVIQGSQTGGAPQTSGTAQTYGLLRLQGTTFTSVLDFGTNGGNYNWIQATDSSNLATNYSLAINPNGGNVGIGTSSPACKLDVLGSSNTSAKIKTTATGSYGVLQVFNSNTNGEASIGYRDDSDSDATSWVVGKSVGVADAFGWYYGGTKMLIDSSGNLGIGTASPSSKLHVNGGMFATGDLTAPTGAGVSLAYDGTVNKLETWSSTPLAIRTAGVERMRIDSSGNLLVGTTSSGSEIGLLTVKQSFDGDGGGLRLIAPNSSNAWATRTGTDNNLYFGYNGTSKASINSSSGAYSALSDARLKINVIDSVKGLSVVAALRPVEYNMKDDPTGANQIGLIAQEVLEVLPEVVSIPSTEDYFYGMNYAGVVPILIKAIQEQQALITALTARITALETP